MGDRRRLPDERPAVTRRLTIGTVKLYVTVGLYDDGSPGEVFCRIAKEGSSLAGLLDGACIAASLALQHGMPVAALCRKWAHMRFEPSGWTGSDEFGYAVSPLDLLARWVARRFLTPEQIRDSLAPPEGPVG